MRIKAPNRLLRTVLATAVASATLTVAFDAAPASALPDPGIPCVDSLIKKTLTNGASWRMCARIDTIKGLVLESVEYKPPTDREYSGFKRVLDSLYLANLNVPYDTGHVQYDDIPSYGFGKQYLMEQNAQTCPKGKILGVPQSFVYRNELIERVLPGICMAQVPTGLMTHAQETQIGGGVLYVDQGTGLQVSSISKISWYEYQQRITFDDHGSINVDLGATGDIAPGLAGSNFFSTNPKVGWPLGGAKTAPSEEYPNGQDTYATSHWHNAIWRVDFGIDRAEKQVVEQYDYTSPGAGARAPIVEGTAVEKTKAFSSTPGEDSDELTWWRVMNPNSKNRDGHPRSIEIVNDSYPNRNIPHTKPIVSFTNDYNCQEYARANLNAGCPGLDVLDYVAADTMPLTDPVGWVNVGFHHIDRDEDQSPMPIHWQKFSLVMRDFFAVKPTMTEARSCINGPFQSVNRDLRPCIATNITPPTISASSALAPGTVLTAEPGTWNTALTTWDYQYLWFRNGEPIEGGVGETYTLSSADRGTTITVKVTASQTGYPSGTAESAGLFVPLNAGRSKGR